MLTIKHIRPDGAEAIDIVRRALWYPAGAIEASSSPTGTLTLITPTSDSFDIDCGTVYVMNEQGKTVGVYDITPGVPRQPHRSAA